MSDRSSTAAEPVVLAPDCHLRCIDVEDVARNQRSVTLADQALDALSTSADTLAKLRQQKALIYGLTTGFGPLAGHFIDGDATAELQQNLVYHLASGTGSPLTPTWARALICCRAATLARGYSALRPETLKTLVTWLNSDLAPAIPRHGSVGASGDLTPLDHMTLALCGEGQILVDGTPKPAAPILAARGISPITLGDRDGLALVNGTSAMTALAAIAQCRSRRALSWATRLGALFADCMKAHGQAFDPLLARVRPHPGQRWVTRHLGELLRDSRRLQDVSSVHNLSKTSDRLPQDAYSLRCIPQMLGAVVDVIDHHQQVVTGELNSVTDNPIIDTDGGRAVHGGNFFGQQIALCSDYLNQSLIVIAVLAERQIARITDPKRSPFAPFLQPHRLGLQSGLMGAQVTASSTVARLRSLATPLAIQSISTNGGNQDVNPMGTLAALRSHQILDGLFEVLAILALSTRQAHFLATADDDHLPFSGPSTALATFLADQVEPIVADRPLAPDIAHLAAIADDPEQRRWLL